MNIIKHRPPRRAALALAAAALLLAGSAQATLLPLQWNAGGRFEQTTTVAAAGMVEVCGPLRKGQVVQWRFDAALALDFNIHFHEGREVRLPVQQRAVQAASGSFTAPQDQSYCWMWSHQAAQAGPLQISLTRL